MELRIDRPRTVGVGLLGAGHVGQALLELLESRREAIQTRLGAEIAVRRIAVRRISAPRLPAIDPRLLVTDPRVVIADPEVDIVVELMGGVDPALDLLTRALSTGKPVVTANKALLADHGQALFRAAEAGRTDLYFEGSVGGGLTIIRPLKETIALGSVRAIGGVLNGTSNFVLGRLSEGIGWEEAVSSARRLGFAEADVGEDVSGLDTARKLAILSSIAFGGRVTGSQVPARGIEDLAPGWISAARRQGYLPRLVGWAERADGRVLLGVEPMLVPKGHPLADLRGEENCVLVVAESGWFIFRGPGAGGRATAQAVLGDVVEAAGHWLSGHRGPGCTCRETLSLGSLDEIPARYWLPGEPEAAATSEVDASAYSPTGTISEPILRRQLEHWLAAAGGGGRRAIRLWQAE